ncbi:MAG: NAD(+)/NADH kinase [bacterium]
MKVAVFVALNRPMAVQVATEVVKWLRQKKVKLLLDNDGVDNDTDFALAIGGDGTMLSAVRACASAGVPVAGISAGWLGFLPEINPESMYPALARIMVGDYKVESRMMLRAIVGDRIDAIGFNDVVVRQGVTGRLVHLDVSVAGHHLGNFSADGLLVCTPTGSTAYGLAAGGPIIHPATAAMTLVPICPHSLSFRPVVIPAGDVLEILCKGNQNGDKMMITIDGQEPIDIFPGDRVTVSPANEKAKLIKLGLTTFYDRLRDKLDWGGGQP